MTPQASSKKGQSLRGGVPHGKIDVLHPISSDELVSKSRSRPSKTSELQIAPSNFYPAHEVLKGYFYNHLCGKLDDQHIDLKRYTVIIPLKEYTIDYKVERERSDRHKILYAYWDDFSIRPSRSAALKFMVCIWMVA